MHFRPLPAANLPHRALTKAYPDTADELFQAHW